MLKIKFQFVIVWLLFGLSGCMITLVAPYDPEVRSMLVRYSVEVDSFWQQMQAAPKEQRQFANYKDDYQEIEVNLQILLKLNKMRPKNDESSKQTENLLTLWQEDKANHEKNNNISNFIVRRRVEQYQRMFHAMLVAEDAKK